MQMPMMMPMSMPMPPVRKSHTGIIVAILIVLVLGGGGVAYFMYHKSSTASLSSDQNGVMMYSGKNFNGSSYCAKPGVALSSLPFVPQSMKVPAGVYMQYSLEATTTAGGTFKSGGVTNASWSNLGVTLATVTSISVLAINLTTGKAS